MLYKYWLACCQLATVYSLPDCHVSALWMEVNLAMLTLWTLLQLIRLVLAVMCQPKGQHICLHLVLLKGMRQYAAQGFAYDQVERKRRWLVEHTHLYGFTLTT
jgi:hypothetical protein